MEPLGTTTNTTKTTHASGNPSTLPFGDGLSWNRTQEAAFSSSSSSRFYSNSQFQQQQRQGDEDNPIPTNLMQMSEYLKSFLHQSRDDWTQWANEETRRCNDFVTTQNAELQKLQSQIDETVQDILAHKLERELNITEEDKEEADDCDDRNHDDIGYNISSDDDNEDDKENQVDDNAINNDNQNSDKSNYHSSDKEKRHAKIEEQLKELQSSIKIQKEHLQDLQHQASHELGRTQESQQIRQDVEASAEATLFQLNKANQPYKQYLGLDFEKAPNEQLRFLFTLLDPHNPDRSFPFLLAVNNDNDLYELNTCDLLPASATVTMLENLNNTLDMNAFVRSMRQAFVTELNNIPPRHHENNQNIGEDEEEGRKIHSTAPIRLNEPPRNDT